MTEPRPTATVGQLADNPARRFETLLLDQPDPGMRGGDCALVECETVGFETIQKSAQRTLLPMAVEPFRCKEEARRRSRQVRTMRQAGALGCPDETVVGQGIAEVAVDAFAQTRIAGQVDIESWFARRYLFELVLAEYCIVATEPSDELSVACAGHPDNGNVITLKA